MRTTPLPVSSRVKRILCAMPSFHLFRSQEDAPRGLPLDQEEKAIGIYRNDKLSTKEALVITTESILLEEAESWRRIPYSSIARVSTPDSKTNGRGLHLALHDGTMIWLPIRGCTEKTFDAFELLRFLRRVLEDRAQIIDESLSNEELLKIYEEAAKVHGEAIDLGDYKTANKAYDRIEGAYRTLRSRGDEARAGILPFIESDNLSLRAWAAAHALEFRPELGKPVLQELAESDAGLISLEAETTLSEWREGNLRFP